MKQNLEMLYEACIVDCNFNTGSLDLGCDLTSLELSECPPTCRLPLPLLVFWPRAIEH